MKYLAKASVFIFLAAHLHADEALSCQAEGGACHQAGEHVDIDFDHIVELLQSNLELSDSSQGVAPKASKQAKAAYPTKLTDRHQEVAPASRQARAADPTQLTDRHQEVAQAAHAAARGHHVAESTLQQNARLASSKTREAKAQRSSGKNIWAPVLLLIAGSFSLLQGLYKLRSKQSTNERQADEQPPDSTTFVARSCKSLFEARAPPPASRGDQTDQPEWAKGLNETFNTPAWALFQILAGLATIGTGVYFLMR